MAKNELIRIKSFLIFIFLVLSIASSIVSPNKNNNVGSNLGEGYIDITASEAFDLLNSLSNGIQIPIDVRLDYEWIEERINTSFPQDPRHHCLCAWADPAVVQEFISQYQGKEIIIYCLSGGRSTQAAQILVDNNFDGTIYNMIGGISKWKSMGFPTKIGNTAPDTAEITGPTECIIGELCTYYANAADPDSDAVRYGWDFDNDKHVDEWTDFISSDSQLNATCMWDKKGFYTISVIAEDRVGNQSNWANITVSVISNDQTKPEVNIVKPAKYIYFNNKQILPFFKAVVIGYIDIIINSDDNESGLDYVELYINDEKIDNRTDKEFVFNWDEKGFGKYKVKAIAYDLAGNKAEDSIETYKFF